MFYVSYLIPRQVKAVGILFDRHYQLLGNYQLIGSLLSNESLKISIFESK